MLICVGNGSLRLHWYNISVELLTFAYPLALLFAN